MEITDPTSPALEAGTRDIMRQFTDSAAAKAMRLMAESRGSRLLAYVEALRDLRTQVPDCEQKLISLHLELGVYDPNRIGAVVQNELRGFAQVALSLAATFRGRDCAAARREAVRFEADVAGIAAGSTARALVAIERHRRENPVVVKVMENRELPRATSRALRELLSEPEQTWIDWKANWPPGVLDGKHSQRDAHRGKLLKSLVSIANSIVHERGYLVYGVDNRENRRTVVGVDRSFDDAEFQDWNWAAFDPPIQFQFREEDHEGKRVALFEVVPSMEYPHVCKMNFGTELCAGQVWFRRGSRNTVAGCADLKRMCTPQDPLRTEQINGALVAQVKDFWEPQGWEVCWISPHERDEQIARGARLAFAPESRREIRVVQSNVDVFVLMLRPKAHQI